MLRVAMKFRHADGACRPACCLCGTSPIPLSRPWILTSGLQPPVVSSQSFRNLLEFWTFVAEKGDKTKKMVYQCCLRPAARLRSGGPSLGRSPARTSSVTPTIKTKSEFLGKTGSTQFLSRA